MSGFEVVGVVLAVLPLLKHSLEYYETATPYFRRHEETMGILVSTLKVEHVRLIHSWKKLLRGLVEPEKLPGLLEQATEQRWTEAIDKGIDVKIKERLGVGYESYMEIMWRLQNNLKGLRKVFGLEENMPWPKKAESRKKRWHDKVRNSLYDFLKRDEHSQLLAAIDKCNTQLQQLTPDPEECVTDSRPETGEFEGLESTRRSARSLYCAVCSNWSCHCKESHATHFQLQTGTVAVKGPDHFNLIFGLSKSELDESKADSRHWHQVELEALEEESKDAFLSSGAVRTPGRVQLASSVSSTPSRERLNNRIENICNELRSSTSCLKAKCIGFLEDDDRRHYMYVPQRQPAQLPAQNHAISLQKLLSEGGKVNSPFSFEIQLLDQFELGYLLASSLLQLHGTSWLKESWSTEEIYFVPARPDMALRECVFVTKHFLSSNSERKEGVPSTSPRGVYSDFVLNETIFRLGATLVELSRSKTLKSYESADDCIIRELSDVRVARRISEEFKRNNVGQWNEVVDICLWYRFQAKIDFGEKKFRREFYQRVVAPLQKLAEDAKSG